MKVEVTRTLKRVVKMRYEDGVLKICANYFLSERRLRQIIQENSEWINKQKSMLSAYSQSPAESLPPQNEATYQIPKPRRNDVKQDIAEGYATLIFGEVVQVSMGITSKTFMDGNVLFLSEKNYESSQVRLKAIQAYLKKLALTYVSDEVADFGSKTSLCPSKITFKDNGDFWVKCALASQRILCIDFRTVQLPKRLRTYVIAHGFAHFFYPIHDEEFWRYLSDIFPDYQHCAKELEKYRFLKEL